MKKENEYWVDKNGNKWNYKVYTEEQAIKFSGTLINCKNCIDCRDCSFCSDCSDCSDCRDCSDCKYCSDCRSCRSCRYCSDYSSNPQCFVSKKIGSRDSQTIVYWTNTSDVQLICGCFRGNISEFEKAVLKTHANNPKYLKQYTNFIKTIKYLIQ